MKNKKEFLINKIIIVNVKIDILIMILKFVNNVIKHVDLAQVLILIYLFPKKE